MFQCVSYQHCCHLQLIKTKNAGFCCLRFDSASLPTAFQDFVPNCSFYCQIMSDFMIFHVHPKIPKFTPFWTIFHAHPMDPIGAIPQPVREAAGTRWCLGALVLGVASGRPQSGILDHPLERSTGRHMAQWGRVWILNNNLCHTLCITYTYIRTHAHTQCIYMYICTLYADHRITYHISYNYRQSYDILDNHSDYFSLVGKIG